MADEFGPWIEHDGRGCPASLFGTVALIEVKLAAFDDEGGKCGQVVYTETIINELMASLPEWHRNLFGTYAVRPDDGRTYAVPDIIRYRVRKPRALQQLRDLAKDLPADSRIDA